MRERRWESQSTVTLDELSALGSRLARHGVTLPAPSQELICYVEELPVASPAEIERLDAWPTEDVTLIRVYDDWRGDYYLLAGDYQARYRQLRARGSYCSVSHPWLIAGEPLQTHYAQSLFWLGARDTHAFVRVRLHTADVITPGETRADDRRGLWLHERQCAFSSAIRGLQLPIALSIEKEQVALHNEDARAMLLCSWPDAFGPCQFEFNRPDALDLLGRASALAATMAGAAVPVRAYLTGFPLEALEQFQATMPPARSIYRCSVHCRFEDVAELARVARDGRLYLTLCEFQTAELLPDAENAWVIIGLVGQQGTFRLELRLNRAPLPEDDMDNWLEALIGQPVVYAPLAPFP